MVFEELRCQVDNLNSNLSHFILICKELEIKYKQTRQTRRGNKDKSPDVGRSSVHDDETTQGVNDIESPFDRIVESSPHHLDCIEKPHFDDIHPVKTRLEVKLRETDTAIELLKKCSIYISFITIENTITGHYNLGSHGVQVILQFEFIDLFPVLTNNFNFS
jgi:hypothetical protein